MANVPWSPPVGVVLLFHDALDTLLELGDIGVRVLP